MQQWTKNEIMQRIQSKETTVIYIYTAMCGTCQVASKMLEIVNEILPNLPLSKVNINEIVEEAQSWKVESVPCLLIFENGEMKQKIYAFQSVPYLHELLKKYNLYIKR
ncbi:thioredoxin family protein [Gottfriedia acidiceleris]|uniref:Thioredoxin family protein n=1 Tax=Gottfriedia acidiceleris TaxID=371036 RepID=A0ABY4JJA1_9BACI|nr:thioredoxin family protein [Gottfriedia acidiceleris]UPM53926.1 thioredoxin family protein [Gottfriedia acidiceleris]